MTTPKNDGGAAFPQDKFLKVGDAHQLVERDFGMTLRDYFAGQALVGLNAHNKGGYTVGYDSPEARAKESYKQADALIAERDK